MKNPITLHQGIGLLITGLSMACTTALAQVNSRVGTVVNATERATLQSQTPLRVGAQQVRVLDTVSPQARGAGSAAIPVTLVVNEDGVIGQSENVVMISRLPTAQVQTRAARWISQAVSTQAYDHMDITLLRFTTFSEAVAARTAIAAALPEAAVSLPIQYTTKKAN